MNCCFLRFILLCGFLLLETISIASETDVLVYGATPSGIAASIAAGRAGYQVCLVEPTNRVGGLTTSGLSHTDFHSFESLTGTFLEFAQRVESYYENSYGDNSPQVAASFHGTFAEPKVNLLVFQQMLAEVPSIKLRTGFQLAGVATKSNIEGRSITEAHFQSNDGESVSVMAKIYIDASYEGDLMAAAGIPYKVGREGRNEYNESLAPLKSDSQLQAYNFRFIMTRDSKNRVLPKNPPGYRREDFVEVLPILRSGKINKVFDYPKNCLFKAQTPPLPNEKYDINDVSGGIVRLSLPGINESWPEGDAETRKNIFDKHFRDQVGLLYFLQNDADVPDNFRQEALEWGLCKDEFNETEHFPPQLYVREARRMLGKYVFTQQDSEHAANDARAVLHADSIAMGDYGNNCHGTAHEGPRFGGKHTGEFYNPVPPYQIPYGVLIPKETNNLLVPVAASSSHVGFCAIRLEPIWMSLGQAAGHAAVIAIEDQTSVQLVSVSKLQSRLHAHGSATIYTSDVPPSSPDFAAVQWWATLGGLHGLEPMPAKPGQRGKNIHGQYYEANPGHEVKLNQALNRELFDRWYKLALKHEISEQALLDSGIKTRGDFIRAAFQSKK